MSVFHGVISVMVVYIYYGGRKHLYLLLEENLLNKVRYLQERGPVA